MKEKIKAILGKNHTTPAVIISNLNCGIYTWEDDVFCLKDGDDLEFDELEEDEKKTIMTALETGKYVLDDTYQG